MDSPGISDAALDALAAAVALPINPADRPAVAAALARLMILAAIVRSAEGTDAAEPAPVFTP